MMNEANDQELMAVFGERPAQTFNQVSQTVQQVAMQYMYMNMYKVPQDVDAQQALLQAVQEAGEQLNAQQQLDAAQYAEQTPLSQAREEMYQFRALETADPERFRGMVDGVNAALKDRYGIDVVSQQVAEERQLIEAALNGDKTRFAFISNEAGNKGIDAANLGEMSLASRADLAYNQALVEGVGGPQNLTAEQLQAAAAAQGYDVAASHERLMSEAQKVLDQQRAEFGLNGYTSDRVNAALDKARQEAEQRTQEQQAQREAREAGEEMRAARENMERERTWADLEEEEAERQQRLADDPNLSPEEREAAQDHARAAMDSRDNHAQRAKDFEAKYQGADQQQQENIKEVAHARQVGESSQGLPAQEAVAQKRRGQAAQTRTRNKSMRGKTFGKGAARGLGR